MIDAINRLKPKFWDYRDAAAGPREQLFNFRRMWKLAIFFTAGVTIIPLIVLAVVDYQVNKNSIESENLLRTARLVSNTQRTISSFLTERMAALDFIAEEKTFETLNDQETLEKLLANLKKSFGGFIDIGVIDSSGTQRAYAGPYKLVGKDYSKQVWYKEVLTGGVYLSEVFLGFRHVPHRIIAVKRDLSNGFFYVLRAALDTKKLDTLLTDLEIGRGGDAFMIDRQGILQTPSVSHGNVLEKISFPVPEYAPNTRVFHGVDSKGKQLIIGYRYITGTPFILLIVEQQRALMEPWYKIRLELIAFSVISIIVILSVVIGMVTYLINKIYVADQTRIATLHQVEYTNKMASIGRLAAGVAHEINNPLAIINEKAGLIKDFIAFKKEYAGDERLAGLVNVILSSVKRAGTITKRLLSFSRNFEIKIQPVNLKVLIEEVLSFMAKEAEYRQINISVKAPEAIQPVESDRGKLQEIFLNLFNNACCAMNNGGHLDISIMPENTDFVLVTVADDGCGIPKKDIERIFEPFFSTKTKEGGTGLGLSLTSNFVREVGGTLSVESDLGKGTIFKITLPYKMKKKIRGMHASITDR